MGPEGSIGGEAELATEHRGPTDVSCLPSHLEQGDLETRRGTEGDRRLNSHRWTRLFMASELEGGSAAGHLSPPHPTMLLM